MKPTNPDTIAYRKAIKNISNRWGKSCGVVRTILNSMKKSKRVQLLANNGYTKGDNHE